MPAVVMQELFYYGRVKVEASINDNKTSPLLKTNQVNFTSNIKIKAGTIALCSFN